MLSWCDFQQVFPISHAYRRLEMFKLNHTSLLVEDYYCEVWAINCLESVDENPFLESKIVLKRCSDRKPTSPIKLQMLLGSLTEEG